jgi:DNA adenine methylase
MAETKKFTTKPFLRWAGGKTRSIPFLEKHLPPNVSSMHRYYEPFIGAGSLFFHIKPSKAILSDNNKDLIECYETVQKRPDAISTYLKQYLSNTCEGYYYKMRKKYNTSKHSIARAALFIYLNKTCFNGIWRVNKKGEFNVPYGFKEPPALPSKEELRNVSIYLSNVELIHSDYKEAVKNAERDDFIYFDPPYLPINGTSCFTRYTRDRFTKDDHDELALLAKKLTSKGCHVLISNAESPYR